MQRFVACFLLFCTILLVILATDGECSSLPQLTIDQIEGNNGIIKIHYTTSDPMGRLLSTANWKYSTNGGATWIIINQSAIQNNEPKLSGQHFILWNTNEGLNNLSGLYQPSILLRMEAFDIDVGPAGQWRKIEDMSFARAFLTAAVINDDIVVIGGQDKGKLAPTESYNLITEEWIGQVSMPVDARIDLGAAFSSQRLYLVGGYDGRRLSTVELYIIRDDIWKIVKPMPTPRQGLSAAIVDGKLYALGGRSESILDVNEVYDPATDSWKTVAPMINFRQSFATATLNNRIYAIGGHGNEFLSDVEAYDPRMDKWQPVASMPTTRYGLTATIVNGQIYAIGGSSSGKAIATVEIYDPKTDTWRTSAPMTTPRRNLASVSIGEKIYAIGGANEGGALATVEEFTIPRTSDVAISNTFAVANHMIAEIISPSSDTKHSGTVSIRGTAIGENFQSWTLDYQGKDDLDKGFVPISFSNHFVDSGSLGEWDVHDFPDGEYLVRLRITDNRAVTIADQITVAVDNTPPIFTCRILGAGLEEEYIRNNTAIIVSGTSEPKISVVEAALVLGDGSNQADVTDFIQVDQGGRISGKILGFELTDIFTIRLSIIVADVAGNQVVSGSNHLIVDNEPPVVEITSPAVGANFSGGKVLLSGNVSDEFSGVRRIEVDGGFGWVLVADTSYPNFRSSATKWSYEYAPPIGDVLLSFRARATDKAGNIQISNPKLVNYMLNLPSVNISEPTDGANLIGSISITGTVDAVDLGWKLEYAPGSNAEDGWIKIASGKENRVVTGLLALWDMMLLPDGPYTLRLTAENAFSTVSVKRQNLFKTPRKPEVSFQPNTPANIEFPDLTLLRKQLDQREGITFKSSAFSDPNIEDVHTRSQWQIRSAEGNYDSPVYDSGADSASLTDLNLLTSLDVDRIYYWRVRHQDSSGKWSEYSAESFFTTKAVGRFTVSLKKGLNFMSMPVRPIVPMDAVSLAQKLKATLIIRFDAELQDFVSYVPGISRDVNFSITGGEGYIVNILESKSVPFEGTIWEDVNAAPSPAIDSFPPSTWAFVIGLEKAVNLPDNSLIEVINRRTNKSRTRVNNQHGSTQLFSFVDMDYRSVVDLGDPIRIRVTDTSGYSLFEPINLIVTTADLLRAVHVVSFNPSELPDQTRLFQNYPNPFNPETWIPFELTEDSNVKITIYDVSGSPVQNLDLGFLFGGKYRSQTRAAYWNGQNQLGELVGSGIYFYRLSTDRFSSAKKMIVVK